MVRAWRKRISMVSHNIQKFAKKKKRKVQKEGGCDTQHLERGDTRFVSFARGD